MGESGWLIKKAELLLQNDAPILNQSILERYVRSYLDKRDKFLNIPDQSGSPLYLIDIKALNDSLKSFSDALYHEIPDGKIYYAMKSCNHPIIVKDLINRGCGIDVSSGKELELVLSLKARDIIFSGPGKTDDELTLAVENCDKLTVLVDSFGELNRLDQIAASLCKRIKIGIRLTTQEDGLWRKFGIPLDSLTKFFRECEKHSNIELCGLQFHTSWNRTPDAQCNFIERLGKIIKELPHKYQSQIKFIDIGGGYWPPQGEWLQPEGTPQGQLKKAILDKTEPGLTHYCLLSTPIREFMRSLGNHLKKYIFNTISCQIFVEPGRWLSHNAINILLTVVDKKSMDIVITDGGINMIGWERFENDYFPIINLTRPDLNEQACYIFGSLCTPHDIWGYSYFGADINIGDKLLIPSQGAYTYSLRQEFIKPIPDSILIDHPDDMNEKEETFEKIISNKGF